MHPLDTIQWCHGLIFILFYFLETIKFIFIETRNAYIVICPTWGVVDTYPSDMWTESDIFVYKHETWYTCPFGHCYFYGGRGGGRQCQPADEWRPFSWHFWQKMYFVLNSNTCFTLKRLKKSRFSCSTNILVSFESTLNMILITYWQVYSQ